MADDDFYDKIGTDVRPKKNHVQPAQGPVDIDVEKLQKETDGDKNRWGNAGDFFYPIQSTYETLPSGLYSCRMVQGIGPALQSKTNNVDDLIKFPDSDIEDIITEFNEFWSKDVENKFRERGFIHKRGFLLHGPPGSGKTSCIQLLVKTLIERYDGINVMIDNPEWASECLTKLRSVEPTRPIIGIIEDLDALVDKYDEDDFLMLIDGENQIDNVIYVATTNYPQRLDARFIDRPSRFDTIKFIDMPNSDARRLYFETKEPSLSGEQLEKWVVASEGFSIAHLKEMIIAVRCFNQDFDSVIKRLKIMKRREITSENYDGEKVFGFVPKRPQGAGA